MVGAPLHARWSVTVGATSGRGDSWVTWRAAICRVLHCGDPQVVKGSKAPPTNARFKQLERENVELRRANEILRLASAHLRRRRLDRRAK